MPIAAALIAAILANPIYMAESRLLILLGDDYVFKSQVGANVPGFTFDRSQIVHAETEIIQSRDLAQDTIQAVGLRTVYPRIHAPGDLKLQLAVQQFQKDLTIENVPQSNVIKLSLRNSNRQVSAAALNKLVELYLIRRRGIFEQNNKSSVDSQMQSLKQQMAKVEAQLQAFSTAHRFADYQQELNAVQAQQISLKTQLQAIDQQLADQNGRLTVLDKNSAATPPVIELSTDLVRSQRIDALNQTLLSLENQQREAAAEYVAGSPIIAELDRRIAKLKAEIAASPTQQINTVRRGVNPVHQDVDTQLRASQAAAAGLTRSRAETTAALQAVTDRLVELVALGPQYREMVRIRALLEESASALAKQSEETRILSGGPANVRVLQAATAPIQSHTGRPLMLMFGLAVGLIAASATTLVSAVLFQGMLSPVDVEQKLAIPVALTVSSDPDAKVRTSDRGDLGSPAPMYMTPNDVKVLDHLVRGVAPGGNRSLQMIGPTDGVGVSNLLIDYALLAAREKQKVLVLDMEPLSGRSCSDILVHRGAMLRPVGGDGLVAQIGSSSLFITPPRGHDAMPMGERDWTTLLAQTSKEYDLVLIDAPPLSRSWLGLFAAPSVDVTLAVIAAEETRAPVALNLVERIGGVGGLVAAAILNKRRFYIPETVYNWL